MIYNVIIADDSDNDIELISMALKKTKHFNIVFKATDGMQVMDYLARRPPFDDVAMFPAPHLLLLDLKMGRTGGFQVMKWIKDNSFPIITVVITGYDIEEYVSSAKRMGATAVFAKPMDKPEVARLVTLAEQLVKGQGGDGAE